MDSGGYASRVFPAGERNVGGTHGLYLIFFLLEHVTSVVPLLCLLPAAQLTHLLGGGVGMLVGLTVAIPVAFTPPSAQPRIAADGTFVLPRRAGAVQSACDAAPGLVRAALEPPAAGVTCRVAGGSLCVEVAPDVGPGEHTCVVTRADGTPEGRRVAIVAY